MAMSLLAPKLRSTSREKRAKRKKERRERKEDKT
jgi:hypothetical protein